MIDSCVCGLPLSLACILQVVGPRILMSIVRGEAAGRRPWVGGERRVVESLVQVDGYIYDRPNFIAGYPTRDTKQLTEYPAAKRRL